MPARKDALNSDLVMMNQAQLYGRPRNVARVRICANKIVACVRCSTLLPTIRPQDTRQFASAQQINQLEGLAVARSWGFESPLPHHAYGVMLHGVFRRSAFALRARLSGTSPPFRTTF